MASSPRQSLSSVTQPTALGVNDTNVAELSQALQNSLSLDTNTQLPKPNTSVESPPKASCEASPDEHEKENAVEAKVLPAVSGGTEFPAYTSFFGQEYHRDELLTPTATWPPKQDSKPDCVGCPTEEPVCPTQEAKPSGIDKRDDIPKKLQLELKSPPTPVREEEELKRTDDGKERTLEVIAEIPEDVNFAIGNGQQNGEKSSPVQLVTEGNRIITSISQTLDQVAKFPMREDLPPSQLNVRSQANVSDDKQADANISHQVDMYFANPAALCDGTDRPGINSLVGTSLITPLEPNDKEMPKTRRSQSVGQFPSTPSKHKSGKWKQ